MTQMEEVANEACKRLMAQVRRGLRMPGNEDCTWTRSDAGKFANAHVGDLLAKVAHDQAVDLETMGERFQEIMDLVNKKLDKIDWKPLERVPAILTTITPAKMLQASQAMERIATLEAKGAGESKKRLLKTFGLKARAYQDGVTELAAEDTAQLEALLEKAGTIQAMEKLLRAGVQAASDIGATEGSTRQQKSAAKAEVDKAAKAVVDANRALEKARKKRSESLTQQLTGSTRIGAATYNELAAELNIIAAAPSTPETAKKGVAFSDEASAGGEDGMGVNSLKSSDLKDIVRERTEDLFGRVLGVKTKGHWTRFCTQQEQLLFLLSTAKLLAEFATFPSSKMLVFTNVSGRVKDPRPAGVTTTQGLAQALWDAVDKQDLDTTFTELYELIANSGEPIQERYAHMADCVALQHRIKASTPLLQWADPPDDSVATEAYRLLTAKMNDGQNAKAKLHVYNPLTGAQLTLKSATELCANVEKALHMDAKRKAADDGGSPASKRSANFNLLDCPEGPKNGSSTSSNASNPAEAGSFMNMQTGPGSPNMASGTWNAGRYAANVQPQPSTQASPATQAQPQAQPAGQPAADGGQSSNGGAQNGWQRNSPGSWNGGRGGYRGGKGQGKGKGKGAPPICYNCNQVGHRTPDCRLPQEAKPFHTCYSCNGKGHWAANCPQRAAVQFLDGQAQARPPAQATADGSQQNLAARPVICRKCGGVGHRQAECNASW